MLCAVPCGAVRCGAVLCCALCDASHAMRAAGFDYWASPMPERFARTGGFRQTGVRPEENQLMNSCHPHAQVRPRGADPWGGLVCWIVPPYPAAAGSCRARSAAASARNAAVRSGSADMCVTALRTAHT